jgi:hypothetical protein
VHYEKCTLLFAHQSASYVQFCAPQCGCVKVDTHAFCVSVGLMLGKCDYVIVSFIVNRVWRRSEYTDAGVAVVLKYRDIENL